MDITICELFNIYMRSHILMYACIRQQCSKDDGEAMRLPKLNGDVFAILLLRCQIEIVINYNLQ